MTSRPIILKGEEMPCFDWSFQRDGLDGGQSSEATKVSEILREYKKVGYILKDFTVIRPLPYNLIW